MVDVYLRLIPNGTGVVVVGSAKGLRRLRGKLEELEHLLFNLSHIEICVRVL